MLGEVEENQEKLTIGGVPAKIRIEHPQNSSLEH
jgi:hypothetical protein